MKNMNRVSLLNNDMLDPYQIIFSATVAEQNGIDKN